MSSDAHLQHPLPISSIDTLPFPKTQEALVLHFGLRNVEELFLKGKIQKREHFADYFFRDDQIPNNIWAKKRKFREEKRKDILSLKMCQKTDQAGSASKANSNMLWFEEWTQRKDIEKHLGPIDNLEASTYAKLEIERYYLHFNEKDSSYLYVDFCQMKEFLWYVVCGCRAENAKTIRKLLKEHLAKQTILEPIQSKVVEFLSINNQKLYKDVPKLFEDGEDDFPPEPFPKNEYFYRKYSPSRALLPLEGSDNVEKWLESRGLSLIIEPLRKYLEGQLTVKILYDLSVRDINELICQHDDLSEPFCALYSFLHEWWGQVRFLSAELKEQLKNDSDAYEKWTHGELRIGRYFDLSRQQREDFSFLGQIFFTIAEYTDDFNARQEDEQSEDKLL